jgi:Cobalamin biosynthesis protein CobT VWA domain
MSDYRIFTRRYDLVTDAAWLMAHPDFAPFAQGRAAADAVGRSKTLLATDAEIAETLADANALGPDLYSASVAILLDQSGSQRQQSRETGVVAWTDRTVKALIHLGAEVEVLGFTTQAWKGGKSRELWYESGKPISPGRLNDLLHIVYKEPDKPWKNDEHDLLRRQLDFLYREPYLREGIDGEAVEWASDRLQARSRFSKILLVMSDCAPVDDSTMSVNRDGLLLDHLKLAVAAAEASGIAVVAVSNGLWLAERPNTAANVYQRVAYESDHKCRRRRRRFEITPPQKGPSRVAQTEFFDGCDNTHKTPSSQRLSRAGCDASSSRCALFFAKLC